jgi:hypothetical protein
MGNFDKLVFWFDLFGVFENKALRQIFEPKKDEVSYQFGILHNKELCALYWSSNIVGIVKSRRL